MLYNNINRKTCKSKEKTEQQKGGNVMSVVLAVIAFAGIVIGLYLFDQWLTNG